MLSGCKITIQFYNVKIWEDETTMKQGPQGTRHNAVEGYLVKHFWVLEHNIHGGIQTVPTNEVTPHGKIQS